MSFTIRFLPDNRSWRAEESVELSFAAASCGILLEQPCGSKTTCGKCRVRFSDGAPSASNADMRLLGADAVAAGWRLACQIRVANTATVEVPRVARSTASKSFGDDALIVPGFEPREGGGFGLAVDVGTTTLAAALIRLSNGTVTATASALNPQVRFGADVLSRIAYAQMHPTRVRELHDTLTAALDDLVRQCLEAAGVAASEIRDATFVGNPTMLHTLRNLDPAPLGQAPFRGVTEASWRGCARALDLEQLGEETAAYVPPGIRSHVGSDTVAAILATCLDQVTKPTLLIDLGTNSEVALCWSGGLLCASTAAGPAFEGANIHQGMRGVPGAIEEVRVHADGAVLARTIGGKPACGICGSGLVDAVAELLRAGVVEQSGRMRSAAELCDVCAPLAERVVDSDEIGRAFWLASSPEQRIVLTAADVRELQLVKASIAAGLRLLLERAGLRVGDLDAVLLAGAFGNYLRKESALAIGLVPAIDPERVRFVGNAAGAGARLLLVDRRARERAEAVAASAGYVELGGLPEYMTAFAEEIPFPDAQVAV